MKRIAIFGATSVIAHETAKCFAARHAELFLVGRHPAKLAAVRDDLAARGAARVEMRAADLAQLGSHRGLVDHAVTTLGGLDAALIAHGANSDQSACEQSVEEMLASFTKNPPDAAPFRGRRKAP